MIFVREAFISSWIVSFPGALLKDSITVIDLKGTEITTWNAGDARIQNFRGGTATFPAELCFISKSNFWPLAKLKVFAHVP